MKKGAFLLSLASFAAAVYFFISCTHVLPHPSAGCDGSFQISVVTTPDTVNNGHPDGTITVTPTGGTSFSFTLDGGASQTSGIFTGIASGTYQVIGSNNNGCSDTVTVTIATYTPNPNPCPTITVTVNSTNPTSATATNANATFTITMGGRANRVQQECLVAMGSMTGDSGGNPYP